MTVLDRRRTGLLLHPTSLPGQFLGGDIGSEAYRFIDFLKDSGCTVWQMLPLGPTHLDGSPYQSLSVHAANPLLINLEWLVEKDWLDLSAIDEDQQTRAFRYACLNQARETFLSRADPAWQDRYLAFKTSHSDWLDDYSLFVAIKEAHDCASWKDWPPSLAQREPDALQWARDEYALQIEQTSFEQFLFYTQWDELKQYAHSNGILLFGDMPFYVSHDSSDVWVNRDQFLLDDEGDALFVAGVPPDVFSDTGQRWGNPLYDWQRMQLDQFAWWKQRVQTQLELFDYIRIDHFRGLEACWQIPADEETAINGEWVATPGQDLLTALQQQFPVLPVIAEDLGVITDEVLALRDAYGLPGMKILQFAFDGDHDNAYLPHNHETNCVVFTGTHDNDTTLGWYQNLDASQRANLHDYLGLDVNVTPDIPWIMNRMALSSVALLSILPMQDILNLDSSQRMNRPGTTEGNWKWRFNWNQLWPGLAADLKKMNLIYARYRPEDETDSF